jgi:hypothetical protein
MLRSSITALRSLRSTSYVLGALVALSVAFVVSGGGGLAFAKSHPSGKGTPKAHAAAAYYYCEVKVPPHTACSDVRTAQVYTEMDNEAYYTGNGIMYVCERISYGQNGSTDWSRVCTSPGHCAGDCYTAYSGVYTPDPSPAWYTFRVGNNSDYTHTVQGYYAKDWG